MNLSALASLQAQRKLHYKTAFQGLPISIENRKGSVRRGCNKQWGCWATHMHIPYGYIRGTRGVDGDEVDVFLGSDVECLNAYVVHTRKSPAFKAFDEDKVMLGFSDAASAKKAFLRHFNDSRFFGSMDTIPMEEFKKKVLQTKSKPQKLVRTKLEQAMEVEKVKGVGEPDAPATTGHMDSQPTFHPPSLGKKAKRVPTDDPMEKDDKFLDVTKRKSKATERFRKQQMKQHNTLGGIPPNTAVAHHQGFNLPLVQNQ